MTYKKKLEQSLDRININTKPASKEEVQNVEEKYNFIIPKALKEFLLLVGKDYDLLLTGGGGAKQGIDNYDYIYEVAEKLIKECNVELMPFFPFTEYGDQFLFVYLDDGDDPPVYRFETELFYCGDDYIPRSSSWGYPKGVSKIADSFSTMIEDVLKERIKESNE